MVDQEGKFPTTKAEAALDVSAIAASFTPIVGGAISAVLSGFSQTRKLNRIAGMLDGLAETLMAHQSDVTDNYVKTEDFEDLLEQTLRRAAEERNDEVRALYRRFLFRAITKPGDEYDDQLEVLKALEVMRSSHVFVLKALLQPPGKDSHQKMMGSPIQTLRERTELSDSEVKDAVAVLNDLRATNISSLHAMMTSHGSEALERFVTHFGRRILEYIDG
jgi:hypothetical protein